MSVRFGDLVKRIARQDISRHNAYPDVFDGLVGVRFVAACQASSAQHGAWVRDA